VIQRGKKTKENLRPQPFRAGREAVKRSRASLNIEGRGNYKKERKKVL